MIHRFGQCALAVVYVAGCTTIGAAHPAATSHADPVGAQTAAVAISVDAAADRHAISPLIYGMNFADPALITELRLPVNRWGGNATTRYNWQNDMANHANDYFFENIPEQGSAAVKLPDESEVNNFIERNRAASTATLLTVPMIGWTPARRVEDHPYDCGFKVSVYGAQQKTDKYDTNCGNGLKPDGAPVTGNNPADTSTAIGPQFVADWIAYLKGRYGGASGNGVRFYNLDNEPGLWPETHRDVFPQRLSYDDLRDRTIQYAGAIKAADPAAQTLGPVQDGWTRYFYSSYGEYPDTAAQQDRDAHGAPFVPWYLKQMRAYEQQHGTRLLDYLDLHYYPQADGVSLSPAGDASTQALRLRSTRALWDPTYIDESWIPSTGDATPLDGVGTNGAVQLIPRMRHWVANNYPGTKLAIGEYNWGALDSVNGALAQAEVLGIFGREGVDLATLWAPPQPDQPGAFAFRMYRNYNGQGGSFGDTAVRASSADPGKLAAYAAQRSDGTITLVVINKTDSDVTSQVSLGNVTPGAAVQLYRYASSNPSAITRQPDITLANNGFNATFPASSITTVVIPPRADSAKMPRAFLPLIAAR